MLALSRFSGSSALKTRLFLRWNQRQSSTIGLVVSENRGKGKHRAKILIRMSRLCFARHILILTGRFADGTWGKTAGSVKTS